MVVAVFPLAKIGLLLLKQLSKPVANIVKNEAKKHPQVRRYVIVPIGRAYRWIENQALMGIKGVHPKEVEQVSDEEAVELGANAMGEMILFGLLCLILLAEINRQGDKKAVMEKTKAEEITNLQDLVLELNEEISHLKKSLSDIQYLIQNPPSVFDLEVQRRQPVTDLNFLDVLDSDTKEKMSEESSPSF